jgi:hypothetical protein
MVDTDEEDFPDPEFVKVIRPYRFSAWDVAAITATAVYNLTDTVRCWWDQFSDLCIQQAMFKRKTNDERAFKSSVAKDIAHL